MELETRRKIYAVLLACLASARYATLILGRLVVYGGLILSIAGIVENVGLFEFPVVGPYLKKVPIEACMTLMGILTASLAAVRAWRSQKRDELLLASLADVQSFFEAALSVTNRLNSHVVLVDELKAEVDAGPYPQAAIFKANFLNQQSLEMRENLARLQQSAVAVYGLDGRNMHAMTSNPLLYSNFKKAKASLLDLASATFFYLPSAQDGEEYIAQLRVVPRDAYELFLQRFALLHSSAGGAVGGLRGAIQAKYFPPTFTFAWALARLDKDP